MESKSRVKLKICGNEFIVVSEDSEEYIKKTGEQVEKRIQGIMEQNESFSISMAAVFAAMEFCDEAIKSKISADNLRAQVQEYMSEASKVGEYGRRLDEAQQIIKKLKDTRPGNGGR